MVRRSFLLAFADKFIGVFMTLATMAIVSRILTPAEVGLFLIASTVVILIEAFRDFGVGAFLIREPTLTPPMVRTAVTIIVLMSLGLGLGTVAGAEGLARYYGDPALAELLCIAALSFLVAPVSNPLLALMRRDMDWGRVAAIGVSGAVANAATTIPLAVAGFGPFSLVWGSVVSAAVIAAGAMWCRPEFWIFRPGLSHWRAVIPFGAWSTIVTLLGMAFDAFPRLILGRILGFGAVGLFARAVSITQLPDRLLLSAVQPVLLPALSDHARRAGKIQEPFLLGLSYVSGLQWPVLAMIALLADPVVRILLGAQWLEIVPLVRIVALSGLCLFPIYICYPVLVTLGHVRDMALAMLLALPPCFGIMLLASTAGLQTMAFSLFLTGPVQVGTVLYFVHRRVPFALSSLAQVMARAAVVTLCTVALPICVLAAGQSWTRLDALTIAGTVIGAAVGWIFGLFLARHPLRAEVLALRKWIGARMARKHAIPL